MPPIVATICKLTATDRYQEKVLVSLRSVGHPSSSVRLCFSIHLLQSGNKCISTTSCLHFQSSNSPCLLVKNFYYPVGADHIPGLRPEECRVTLLKRVNMDVAWDLREEMIQDSLLHGELKHLVGNTSLVHRAIHHAPCVVGPRFAW